MKNIQKLISELEDERENANKYFLRNKTVPYLRGINTGYCNAFSLCIQKLKLLLKDESNQPQPPDFANTSLGEVPQGMNAQQEDVSQAVGGEAPVVGQNEQTKEDGFSFICDNPDCPHCLEEQRLKDEGLM